MRAAAVRATGLVTAVLVTAGAGLAGVAGVSVAGAARPARAQTQATERCDWPQWGHGLDRTFAYPCDTAIAPDTVQDLRQVWFFNAKDTVTATPAVAGNTVYAGDWSGNFYAVNVKNGKPRWTFKAPVHEQVYAGQIVSSAAVASVDGAETVYFGGGKTLYALRAKDGRLRWKYEVGRPGDDEDPSEIESSPVVVDGTVIFGTDVHNSSEGEPAGVYALDAASGEERWVTITAPTEGEGATGPGCADVWGSPSVDVEAKLVFVGTGNCNTSPRGFGRFTEAIVALDLDSGDVRWTYSAHEPNNDDVDFAGAPNLFEAGGRRLVGLGNKDAVYYVVDRATGELVWKTKVTEPGIEGPNYSTGGFIGGTAVADGIIVGGTAVGGSPALHALDAATGAIKWQQSEAGPTYASAAEANGVVLLGGTTDFSLRALDLESGEVLWSQELRGGVAGGAVVVDDNVYAVAGIREPGVGNRNRNSGIYRFSLSAKPVASASTRAGPQTPTTPPNPEAAAQECVASACALDFSLTSDRLQGGPTPSGTVQITLDPFRIDVQTEGLGEPSRWLRPGSAAQGAGATTFGVYLSQGTDNPTGGVVCGLDDQGDCTGKKLPGPKNASYDRVSILAVRSTKKLPSLAEGFDRLVSTNGLRVPITPKAGK